MLKDFEFYKELQLAKKLMYEANKKLLTKTISNINFKLDKSLATDLDLACENYILSRIKKIYPNDNFVSEETNSINQILDRSWVLDPIDGTNCFIKGYHNWGIQLAFVKNKEVQFSLILLPKFKQMFFAAKNFGVYLNNKKLNNLVNQPLNLSVIEYIGAFNNDREIANGLVAWKALAGKGLMQVSPWGACYSFTNMAQGRNNLTFCTYLNPWDLLPGEFMVLELGAKKIALTNDFFVYSACDEGVEILKKAYNEGEKNVK